MSEAIALAKQRYVEAVTNEILAFLRKQGVTLTTRGEEQIADIIRFETTP